ncbi:thiol reductant ABC exporter subunit CydD [Nocardioides sp.]|uniref:thiol reductant ABC exporter subunit CydD n=1 Tax=Nocardioides sp. TaxID=35761 RepID=UPI003527F8A7
MRPLDPRIQPFLRPALRPLGGVLAGGVSGGLLTVAQAFAMGVLLVRLVSEPGSDSWHQPAWWLAGIVVARALAAAVVDAASATAAGAVSVPLRHRLVESAFALDAQQLARRRTGELALLATRGMAAIEPYLTRYVPTMVLAGVLPAATVLAIFWLDWLSGLIVLLTLPLVPVFAILIGLATKDRADKQWRTLSVLSGHFLDVVRGLPTLVAYRRAGAQSASIRRITDRYRRATLETLKIAFASSAALELIATISVALVAVSVGLRLASGSVDFETAMVVLLLAPEAYWPLRRVGAEFHAAAEGAAAFEEASVLLDTGLTRQKFGEHEAPAGRTSAGSTRSSAGSTGIEVAGLTLGYAGRERPVVSGLDARFPSPGMTAVVGPSGCGKSTLLAALLGELEPREGRIVVAGTELADLDPADWHAQVAWAPQRPWLTAGSIAANLRVGAREATDEQLWEALARVRLAEVVRALPEGLAHRLGDDGAGLSAGQQARLSLARVVLADRPVVVLDEPTAHLDTETEAVLLDTLRDLARTACVVVVAHRPAVVEAADHVLTLPDAVTAPPAGAAGTAGPPTSADTPEPGPATREAPTQTQATASTPADDDRGAARSWLGTLLGTLSVASGVALTATAAWLITRASEHPPVLVLMVAIVGVRTFGLARPVLRYAERLVSHDAALRLLAERRALVYDGLVPLVPGGLGRRRGDLLSSIVDDVDSLVDERLRVRQPAWTAVGVGGLATLLALLLSPVAGLVTAAVVGVGALGGLVAHRGVASAEPEFVAARAALSELVEQILASARDLVLWGADDAALDDLDRAGVRLSRAVRRSARAVAIGRMLPLLAGGAGFLAMAALVPADAVSPALRALLVMLPIALVDPLAMLPDAGALSVRTTAAQRRLDDLAALPATVDDPSAPTHADLSHPRAASEGLTAGWGGADVLVDLDVDLPAGGRVGLVGTSGTGKSTYAAVLMRFLDPHHGRQTLAGADLRDLALDDVRRTTGLVDDDPHLFASTLVENVRLARPDAEDDEVRRALDAAHLGAWVDGLPEGLDTPIGEGSAHVSGGERARIAVARALLADAPVLVLDEPTAHLDSETAGRVAAEILGEHTERSIVWITHGTVGLDRMDQVIRLGETRQPAPT